ncbi:MAG: sodium:solute symporter family protein [Flavobacteriales bacterium]
MLIAFVILFLGINIVIGYIASKRVANAGDFVQAGRKLPMFMNATALFALWFGSETVFGASGAFLEDGLLGVIEDPFGGVLALVLFGLFYVRKLYRLNILTLNDLLRDKFGKTTELISGFFMIISFFGYIAAQFIALAIILEFITDGAIPFTEGVILCSVLVTFYTFIGGMWAVSFTDFFQSILIVVGLTVASIYLTIYAGGTDVVFSATEKDTFDFFPDGEKHKWTEWGSAWLVLGLGSLCSQDIFQRANSARSEKAAVRSTFLGAFFYLVFAMLPLYIALCAKAILPAGSITDTQVALPQLIMNHTPLIIQILFFGSLLSAILSTCSGALLAPASILSENIIKPLSNTTWTDKKFLYILRLSVVIMALISTIFAFSGDSIYNLVGESSILGIVTLLVPITCALYWKRASKVGAILSMFFGFTSWWLFTYGYTIGFIYPYEDIPTFLPALLLSIFGMLAGSLLFKHKHNTSWKA